MIQLETEDKLEYIFNPISSGSLNFKIRASNDAHVALTSSPQESDPMYEIFIGGWSNSKSVIRRNRTKPDVAESETPDILNGDEFRGFWIRWHHGFISAGKEGEEEPFLSYTDPAPFGIGYFGVCTGWGASGTWKIEGEEELTTPDTLQYTFKPVLSGSLDIDVRAPSNAHVALCSAKAETDPMYEIILGGWDNTASVIRYCKQKPDKVRKDTPQLLHHNDIRRFVIQWHKGHITVHPGTRNAAPILEWKDPNPFGISHFGVRTAWGATGKWRISSSFHRRAPPSAPAAYTAPPSGYGNACWVAASGGSVPPTAIQAGQDNGEPVYVARSEHEGALIPGKLVPSHGCAYIPWGGAEHGKEEYEVLCDCASTWVPTSGGQIPAGAVAGGQSEDGEPLFVGRVDHNGGFVPGKVQSSHNVIYIPYGGEELGFPDYEILVSQ